MTRPDSSCDEADVRVVAGASPRAPSPALPAPTTAAPVDGALGLTCVEAARRRAQQGPNVLPAPPRERLGLQLLAQLTHLFALMLWVAAALALLAGLPQLAVAIVVVVLVNGLFAFIQEHRADRAASRLREMVPSRATVRRDGLLRVVDPADVVVGDLVVLASGERVCADLEVSEAHAFVVDESMLTGESAAVRPTPGRPVLCGTFVMEGEAEGVAVATGSQTRIARIADLTQRARPGTSPLTRELNRVVRAVSVIALTVGAGLFGVALLLGLDATDGFLLGLGVTVALVPEGLLPTVTLSLARSAQRMATRHALVRHLEAVETLGATTFICTDKTGTLTLNQMSVVRAWTPDDGSVAVPFSGYDASPPGDGSAQPSWAVPLRPLAAAARAWVRGRVHQGPDGAWTPQGDPMQAALDVLARRVGAPDPGAVVRRHPYTARRRRSSVLVMAPLVDGAGVGNAGVGGAGADRAGGQEACRVLVLGSPEGILAEVVAGHSPAALAWLETVAAQGLRILAVAAGPAPSNWADASQDELERDLTLLGMVALQDPPRTDVTEAVGACHQAGIRIAMVTGDHPATALAIGRQVGVAGPRTTVVTGSDLPADAAELAELLRRPDGVVVARVDPEDKLRIALALRAAGEVVAMTGDGVNDAPALRAADVGVAMGASGSDVARAAADVVLLDDHFASIVAAVELGRATFSNVRRFLTFHLTDNVAELAPFAVWALSTGHLPLALGVLQILALDIGTDMMPALALGAEPPGRGTMQGSPGRRRLIDRWVLVRAFAVLGPTEAVGALTTFVVVLVAGGWQWGATPAAALLATASGSAFLAIAVGQLANAMACRDEQRPVWALLLRGNPLLAWALGLETILCLAFVGVPPLAEVLGGSWPGPLGFAGAGLTGVGVVLVDALHKSLRHRGGRTS